MGDLARGTGSDVVAAAHDTAAGCAPRRGGYRRSGSALLAATLNASDGGGGVPM